MDDQGIEGSARAGIKRLIKKLSRPAPWPEGGLQVPRLQTHRGYRGSGAIENTLAAFRAAKLAGAAMCELDVRLTKDKVVVVFHDDTIERFSDRNDRVDELSFTELKEVLGSTIEISSLYQVLTDDVLVPMKFNIEIKSDKAIDDPLERKVFEVIEATSAHGRVLISSFNPLSLWRFGLHTKKIPLALLVGHDMKERYLEDMWFAPLITFHVLNLDDKLLPTAESVKFWRSQGVPICVWTINAQARAQELLDQGVLSIISDEILNLA